MKFTMQKKKTRNKKYQENSYRAVNFVKDENGNLAKDISINRSAAREHTKKSDNTNESGVNCYTLESVGEPRIHTFLRMNICVLK